MSPSLSSLAVDSLLILVLIIANGLFSGSEIAIVSARKLRLEQMADKGQRSARIALRLLNAPNDFLATVQVGITLIGVLSGAMGGATAAQHLQVLLVQVPGLQASSEVLSFGIVVTVITFLSLVVGELVPKRIALSNPEQIACMVAPPMRLLARWSAPLVHLLATSTNLMLAGLGIRASEQPELTEDEIKAILRQGAESGVVEEAEHEIVQRVFRLGDRPIKAMMTPRTDICWLDLDAPLEENLQEVMSSNHSRFPVARENLDDCLGLVRGLSFLSALLDSRAGGKSVNLEAMLQPPLYVTESAPALTVIEQFRASGVHIALVTDEFGGIEGLVTLNDIMEALVGELPSAEDQEDPMVIQRDDGSWLLDGALDIADLKDLLELDTLPDEAAGGYHTLGGLVMHVLERIPRAGEHFDCGRFRLEVVDMDGKRVDKVLVSALEPASASLPDPDDDA